MKAKITFVDVPTHIDEYKEATGIITLEDGSSIRFLYDNIAGANILDAKEDLSTTDSLKQIIFTKANPYRTNFEIELGKRLVKFYKKPPRLAKKDSDDLPVFTLNFNFAT